MDSSTFIKVSEYLEQLHHNSYASYSESEAFPDTDQEIRAGSCHSSVSIERKRIAERKISVCSSVISVLSYSRPI